MDNKSGDTGALTSQVPAVFVESVVDGLDHHFLVTGEYVSLMSSCKS